MHREDLKDLIMCKERAHDMVGQFGLSQQKPLQKKLISVSKSKSEKKGFGKMPFWVGSSRSHFKDETFLHSSLLN